MTVRELINMLDTLNPNAVVHIDDEGYPIVNGVYSPDDFDGDPEDAPPPNTVLLKVLSDIEI